MDLRLALHELEAAHGLDDGASRRLQALAGLGDEPRALKRWLPLGRPCWPPRCWASA